MGCNRYNCDSNSSVYMNRREERVEKVNNDENKPRFLLQMIFLIQNIE